MRISTVRDRGDETWRGHFRLGIPGEPLTARRSAIQIDDVAAGADADGVIGVRLRRQVDLGDIANAIAPDRRRVCGE
ncbi:MAG: hypothetical protein IPK32_26220 [Verrucomicrobiaceae bacterium]|nr:hypothetical protein [Verrucomicrobiaceae bacterium]